MDPERFRRAAGLFEQAVAQPPAGRAAFVAAACAGDAELRRAVEQLLRGDERGAGLDRFEPFATDPLAGTQLGPWRVVGRIAEGGMGVVYRARRADGLFEQEVAIKLLRASLPGPDLLERFEAERRLLARLEHPHVARVLDGGRTGDDAPYLVMEFIDGLPIDRYCEEHRLPLELRVRLFLTVCHTVHFAHSNLVLHRDLKPSNLLVDRHGAVKLLDFGIAGLIGGDAKKASAGPLTPGYASPEQRAGQPLTTASDVYSLGVVLYELLTGRRPPRGTADAAETPAASTPADPAARPSRAFANDTAGGRRSTEEVAAAMQSTPARLRRSLRSDLDPILQQALHPLPERRYASAEQFAEDLERFLAKAPVLARAPTLRYRARCFVRRNALPVAAAAAVFVSLCAALLAAWVGQRRAEEEAQRARREQVRAEAAADHARIEADSFRQTADFLAETFLDALPGSGGRERLEPLVARQAGIVRRQHEGSAHLCANLLDALGRLCLRCDAFDPAQRLIEEAREIRGRAFGEESLEMALSLGSLGQLYYRQGRYAEAEQVLRRALDLHRRLPPDVHSDTATAANDLAAALRRLGRFEEALALHEQALAERRAAGSGPLPEAESLNNLACALLDLGAVERAAGCAAEAVELRARILGEGHASTLQAQMTLAGAEWRREDTARAEALLQQAVEGYRALGPAGEEGLGHALHNLAAVMIQRGELDAAEAPAEEALASVRARLGPDHPQVAVAVERLAQIATRRGDHERARGLWREVVRIRRASLPAGHPLLARALSSSGAALVRAGALAEAEPLLREALAMCAAGGGEEGEEAGGEGAGLRGLLPHVEFSLGVSLAGQGRTAEARELLQSAAARFTAMEGAGSEPARAARRHLEALPD